MIIAYSDEYFDSAFAVCREWAEQVKALTDIAINDDVVKKQFEKCKDYTSIIIDDVGECQGIIAGNLMENTMSDVLLWGETIFYVRPEFRVLSRELFRHQELDLKAKGIGAMIMLLMCNEQEKLIGRFYKGLGFRPLEVQYIKNI